MDRQFETPGRASAAHAAPQGPAVDIRLLGGFRVIVGARVVADDEWRLLKARALVKLLALAPGHRIARERAMEHLWPDADAGAARRSLAYALHVARRALDRAEPGAATRPSLLRLDQGLLSIAARGALRVDAVAFAAAAEAALAGERLRECQAALALYTGDLLPDDRYEDWAAGPRERLGALAQALRLAAVRQLEDADAYEEAIAILAAAIDAGPADEAAHVAIMRIYARSGQRALALAQFRLLRDTLRRDLDAEPDTASQRLYAAILAGQLPDDRPGRPPPRPAVRQERHNLPAPTTALIGREGATIAVRRALDTARLVTLSGAGGVGKTRLALATAWEIARAPECPLGGIWLLDLAPLRDGALLVGLLAATLGLRERAGEPLLETVVADLREQPRLVLLDNCEHLAAPCADLAAALLARCPQLRLLATSREALRVAGELVWRVPSLAPPGPLGDNPDAAELAALAANPAARLFADRARLARPDFALGAPNAGAVAAICRRLDGIPLAIELAAARVAVLPPPQLAARLDDALRLLAGGPRTAPPRHQTLRATLEWSHRLLAPDEQALLARLAVFVGGWTLKAAEATCGLGAATLDLLATLVDKSLVQVELGIGEEELRYTLLETVRQFAVERLAAGEEGDECRARHAAHFRQLAEEAEPHLVGTHQAFWNARLARELDNLRAALSWYMARDLVEEELRLASALFRFWNRGVLYAEGLARLDDALARAPSVAPRVRAKALYAAGALASQFGGDWGAARAAASLELSRALGDRNGQADACNLLGVAARLRGDEGSARVYLEEAQALWRAGGDTWGMVIASSNLCTLLFDQGDYAAAIAAAEEILSSVRGLADRSLLGIFLSSLGLGYASVGRFAEVPAPLGESIRLLAPLQRWIDLQLALVTLSLLAIDRGDASYGAQCLGASARLLADAGLVPAPIQARFVDLATAAARGTLGEEAFMAAYVVGHSRPVEEIVAQALAYLDT